MNTYKITFHNMININCVPDFSSLINISGICPQSWIVCNKKKTSSLEIFALKIEATFRIDLVECIDLTQFLIQLELSPY